MGRVKNKMTYSTQRSKLSMWKNNRTAPTPRLITLQLFTGGTKERRCTICCRYFLKPLVHIQQKKSTALISTPFNSHSEFFGASAKFVFWQ